jgi:hypothetical protein
MLAERLKCRHYCGCKNEERTAKDRLEGWLVREVRRKKERKKLGINPRVNLRVSVNFLL